MVSAAIEPVVANLAALIRDKLESWIAVVTTFVAQNVTQRAVGSLRVSDALNT